jgi:hypothetical protein
MQSKYPQDTVTETINEFVAEVNRRYGIVTKDEREKMEREFGYRYEYSTLNAAGVPPTTDRYTEAPQTNIAILPVEEDDEVERLSGTQKILGEKLSVDAEKKSPYSVTLEHRDLVYRFRCAIDKYFENPDETYTFTGAINAAQQKHKKEQSDEGRFKIVSTLVRGVDLYSKIDGIKYVLFHETVVAGLNTLSAIHSMLARFKQRTLLIDVAKIEEYVWEYFSHIRKLKLLVIKIGHMV